MKLFDSDGNELHPAAPVGELEHICQIGGQFDECSFCIEFEGESLDRHEISAALRLTPTKAWNAGERHAIGNGKTGKYREVPYGRRYLEVEVAAESIDDAIGRFLRQCPALPEVWRTLSAKWHGRIAMVGHASNWNREFNLSAATVRLLAEHGLSLNVDAYFDGETNEP